jgi:hypothetical protein
VNPGAAQDGSFDRSARYEDAHRGSFAGSARGAHCDASSPELASELQPAIHVSAQAKKKNEKQRPRRRISVP